MSLNDQGGGLVSVASSWSILQELARRARQSQPPEFDPTERVLADIRRRSLPPMRAYWALAGVSAAAAAVLAVLGAQAWAALQHPINDWFSVFTMVMQ